MHQQRRNHFAIALIGLLVLGFVATSVISYFVAQNSLSNRIAEESLPLTSDNIYSEINQDLLRSVLIASLMAHDTFVQDWATEGELDPDKIIRYLGQIQEKYHTTTTFFVSEQTRKYYHPRGVLEQVERGDSGDDWYFRVRDMDEPYEINVDADTADRSRLSIFINYQVTDHSGDFIGATGVGLSVDTVAKIIQSYRQRYGREVYFVDREGEVTLRGNHYEGADNLRDTAGIGGIATRLLTSSSNSLEYTAPGGDTVYVNSRFIPELDWYLIVQQSRSSTETRILNTLMLNIAIALLITLLVGVIGWFTIRGNQMQLEQMATTDPLTGDANRQVFGTLFDHVVRAARRSRASVSLIAIDLDEFKPINDTHGHATGDTVLRSLATIVRDAIRETDTLCRWGGDEFIILLDQCDREQAAQIAEKIRAAVTEQPFYRAASPLHLSVSIGVVQHQQGEDLATVMARADAALYQSKHAGRNRVTEA